MAVVSDCHARPGRSATTPASTWVQSEEHDPGSNPLAGLGNFIESEALSADVLLCPGDLCDQARWEALPYVWERLEDLGTRLGADALIATAGNHDIDSRGTHKPELIAQGLRDLAPPFPGCDHVTADDYWSRRISLHEGERWQVVSLNSTLMRELDSDAAEDDHGEISAETLVALKTLLAGRVQDVNVLMCHHHPLPSTHLNPDDRSQMEGGDQLVRLLDELDGPWFVVHGHKHEPDLGYLSGTGNAPVRLASGSVGAVLLGRLGTHVRNQFHLIEFPVEQCEKIHLGLAGQVRSWTWRALTGWEKAAARDGLPANAGFGHRRDGRSLARELIEHAKKDALLTLDRAALLKREPRLEFMLPRDIERLISALEEHGGHVQLDLHGRLDRLVLP